jgi:hypothetical protein
VCKKVVNIEFIAIYQYANDNKYDSVNRNAWDSIKCVVANCPPHKTYAPSKSTRSTGCEPGRRQWAMMTAVRWCGGDGEDSSG